MLFCSFVRQGDKDAGPTPAWGLYEGQELSEAMVHTLRALIADPDIDRDNCFLHQADLINAYNNVISDSKYKNVRKLFSEVSMWLESTFGTQTKLLLGDLIILSCQDFHQGDLLAYLFFALVLHPKLSRIAEDGSGLLLNDAHSWIIGTWIKGMLTS